MSLKAKIPTPFGEKIIKLSDVKIINPQGDERPLDTWMIDVTQAIRNINHRLEIIKEKQDTQISIERRDTFP